MEQVNLIASGYEWICPECERFNTEIEVTETVICKGLDCRAEFETTPPEHVYK